jgi:cytochrome c oxidase assembly protein subunit 15
MRWSYNLERSYAAAVWLAIVAVLVFLMVIVGGATRLTGSGLSITEWRPVTGVIPPLSTQGWAAEFLKYQRIPQYQLVNHGLSLGGFKSLYWWEWSHRLLGRLVGAAILIPFGVLLFMRRIPRRLIWRCGVVLGLVALEGFVGWWMVASGLEARISVAPERLATHLALALLIFSVCVWTALEAWFGRARTSFGADRLWTVGSMGMVALAFIQIMLGALVAGNRAGQVYTDWPLMAGKVIPKDYAPKGARLWDILAHNQAAVQFNHRLGGYLLFILSMVFAIGVWRASRTLMPIKQWAAALFGVVTLQAALGIMTLRMAAPLGLSLTHQVGAVAVLATAIILAWRMQRN